jgi:antimicrobial peptide system SdpB family protein
MLKTLNARIRATIEADPPWQSGYALGRTVIASATALTLALNEGPVMFRTAAGVSAAPFCDGERQLSLFCLIGSPGSVTFELGRWFAVALLVLTAIGWRPRITGVLHWWVAWSLQAGALLVDGGDHIAAALALLLLPQALADNRRWQWTPAQSPVTGSTVIAHASMLAARFQVAFVYLHASLGKLRSEEWANGTALYYWFTDPYFGAREPLRSALLWCFHSGVVVAFATWGVLIVEGLLGIALFMPRSRHRSLLYAGMLLHLGIAVIHGLASFSLAMFGALLIYLWRSAAPQAVAADAPSMRRPHAFDRLLEPVGGRIPSPAAARLDGGQ